MNKVEEGLFAVEEEMPCAPRAIAVWHYALPATLDRAEREEAAARVLSFSRQLNQWVGVSWPRLVEVMQKDCADYQNINDAQNHNADEPERVRRAVRKYHARCMLTLGIYGLFVAKPTAQMREVPQVELPYSGIFMLGPRHVVTGVRELVEKGFLRQVIEGEGENALHVFFPTPALVSHIMRKQGVTAR